IITRFNTLSGTTHGHHTTSAILAEEAFEKSGDPGVFPEHLKWYSPWKAKRIFWNAYSWGGKYEPKEDKIYHEFPVGEFNSLLGTTYSKIAADSRTMHKSQGFGATAQIGEAEDFVELVKGEPFQSGPFQGIANRWQELEQGKIIEDNINGLLQQFDFVDPSNNLDRLLEINAHLKKVKVDLPWVKEKKDALNQLILKVLGFQSLYLANKELSFPTDEVTGKLILNNPSDHPIIIKRFKTLGMDRKLDEKISGNVPFDLETNLSLPKDFPVSQPYWLEKPIKDNLYTVENQQLIGMPFNQPAITGKVSLEIMDQLFEIEIPLKFRYNDQVDGEVIQPFTVLPKITLETDQKNVFLLNGKTTNINITVFFEKNLEKGELGFEGLSSGQSKILEENLDPDNKRIHYEVELTGQNGPEKSIISAFYKTQSGRVYNREKNRILYDHIPNLTYFQPSSFNLLQLDMDLSRQRIGYIPGAGDEVAGVLSNLGYQVEMLENDNFTQERLSAYSTII
ncbi:MAG: PIG-L family deacetylase, partial [Cyclobacteriaceae bacterium]